MKRTERLDGASQNERDRVIARMFCEGQSLEAIGGKYDLATGRVRRILNDRFDLRGPDGPTLMRRYGCTRAQYAEIRAVKADKRFNQQKSTARTRGIGWNLTLGQWWAIWQKSGRWDERGVTGYVMCRYRDKGPYAVGNVYISTARANLAYGAALRRTAANVQSASVA